MTSSNRIVVGIDFGTTFSKVAWALASDPNKIEVIKEWPKWPGADKVPTQIAYQSYPGDTNYNAHTYNPSRWGYDAPPTWRKIIGFKLAFEMATGYNIRGMDYKVVTRDYLEHLLRHILDTLALSMTKETVKAARIDFVLTVPAIWDEFSKVTFEQTAREAKIPDPESNSSVELLSEPESAFQYAIKTITRVADQVRVGHKIVVCDAGGGTVDLIAYDIEDTTPLKIRECTKGSGGYCGASFVDEAFEAWLEQQIGPLLNGLESPAKQQARENFEVQRAKFTGDVSDSFEVCLPGIPENSHPRIRGGYLSISGNEMKRLFDIAVNDIIALLQTQVLEAGATANGKVNFILIVGGFGASEYLLRRVKHWADPFQIKVLRPPDAQTAIVQGAVIKGLEVRNVGIPKTIITRRARRSYGMLTRQVFVESQHLPEDRVEDEYTGTPMARNQIRWYIKAGMEVADDAVFKHQFKRTFKELKHPWRDTLVSSRSRDPPVRYQEGVLTNNIIRSDLSKVDKKSFREIDPGFMGFNKTYEAVYDLVISLKNGNLSVFLECDGKRYGQADVYFDTDIPQLT